MQDYMERAERAAREIEIEINVAREQQRQRPVGESIGYAYQLAGEIKGLTRAWEIITGQQWGYVDRDSAQEFQQYIPEIKKREVE